MSKYTSKYHQDLLEMLGIEPKLSSEKLAQIETWERSHNIKLPAAVLEWYALENVENVIHDCGFENFQIELEFLCVAKWQNKLLLPFEAKNQGCGFCAVLIDGSDDPSVWYDNDSPDWSPVCSSFSDYLYITMWESQVYYAQYNIEMPHRKLLGYCTELSKIDFTQKDYEVITQSLEELPACSLLVDTEKELRFGKRRQRLRVILDKDDAENRAYWIFWALEKEELDNLVQNISTHIKFDYAI